MIFIDANVLLEVILRRRHAKACEDLLIKDESKAISILSIDLVMYFLERNKLKWSPVKKFLESFIWLPITDSDAQWAFTNIKGNDFEDPLQVACAIREGCRRFVTLDIALSKRYAQNIAIDLISK